MAKGLIKSIGTDGKEVLSNILGSSSGAQLTYKETSTYADGTPMSDAKVDGDIYIKHDGKYYSKSYRNEDRKVLTVNSIEDLRTLPQRDIVLLRLGYYKMVETQGYYEPGDGGGFEYIVKYGAGADDGYLIIRTDNDSNMHFVPNIKDVTFPKLSGCKGDGTFDDGPRLNLFFEKSLELGNTVVINWVGGWYTTETIYIAGGNRTFISGNLFYIGNDQIEYMLIIDTPQSFHKRQIYVRGAASAAVNMTNYTWRLATNLVGLGRSGGVQFDGFLLHGARRWGIRVMPGGVGVSTVISSDLGLIRAENCGSVGLGESAVWNFSFDCTGTIRQGSQNSVNQTQWLYVDSIHEFLAVGDILVVDGDPVEIQAFNYDENYISVFPWLSNPDWDGGTIRSRHGGAVRIQSSDAASLRVGGINALRCGVAIHMQGLYGLVLNAIVAQICGVTVVQKGLCYGFNILNFHPETPEGNGIDFLKVDAYETRTTISGLSVLRWGDWKRLVAKNNLGRVEDPRNGAMHGVTVTDGYNGVFTAVNHVRSLSNKPDRDFYANSGNLNLTIRYDEDADRLFNMRTAKLFWAGSRTGTTNYTLTVGISSAQTGEYTIMGSDSWSLPAQRYDVIVEFYIKGKDWRVVWYTVPPVTQNELGTVVKIGEDSVVKTIETSAIIKSKSATLTTATDITAAGDAQTTIGNVTLTDAALGDIVNVNQMNIAGLHIKGVVTAANTIALSAINVTSSDITIPGGTIFKTIILK